MPTTIEHHRDMGAFDYGVVDRVSPLIRRVVARNPTPFTYHGTGTYIVGRGAVAVVDPGPPLESHLDAVLAALEDDEVVTHAFVTHTHSDHSPLTGRLTERTGALSYGFGPHGAVRPDDPDDRVDFSAYISEAEQERYRREFDELDDDLKHEGADTDFVPDVALADGDVVYGDGWTLRAVHTPGHCSNHLCYELLEEAALFSGDHVMGWATSVVGPPDGSMQDYLASLHKLLDLAIERYWPTHGPSIPEPAAYVRSFIAHRTEREDQILAALADGPCRIADFVPRMYAGYDKRLWYPAASSVHAHMLHLCETGRARVVDDHGDPKLTAAYALA
ncbi:MAG TPA: MBL fold metallo-hydrolase [Acidimicrobiaceae bacterium]|nr:MBL fold metallo-hydrolase [Acidimicrobiaceae bacterium]HCB37787.1 MBL fold metallo-hydrolase [Acidimicrobiaceae bacterium]